MTRVLSYILLLLWVIVPRFMTISRPCTVYGKGVHDENYEGDKAVFYVSYFNLFGLPIFVKTRLVISKPDSQSGA